MCPNTGIGILSPFTTFPCIFLKVNVVDKIEIHQEKGWCVYTAYTIRVVGGLKIDYFSVVAVLVKSCNLQRRPQ